MSLPTANVEAQAFGYARCASESTVDAWQHEIHGDKSCACENDMRAMFYWWGVDVMNRTPQDGSDCNCGKCVTDEFACEVIRLLSPGCIVCGCGSPEDRPITCDIVQDVTVYQAADADQELVLPNAVGRTTLIISNQTPVVNNWSLHVGEVATDDGAGVFTYAPLVLGDVVLDGSTGNYYVAYVGGVGPLYPPIDGNLVFFALTLFSRFPGVTAQYNRDVVVEISTDGVTGWVGIYSGPESALVTGYLIPTPVTTSPAYTRTTYYYGEENTCSAGPVAGSIPPFIAPPCGILAYTITPDSTCGTENWTIDIDFTQIDGWNIGTVTPNINGVPGTPQGVALGTLTFGPFIMGDLVTFTLENNIDIACNVTTGVYADPRVGEQDFNVLRAVDANEYAALNGDGEDYYIVSNVDNLVADWGLNVGSIWLGATSTYQAVANLELVYATNPGGALGFWQDDAGTPKQLFPQPTYTYNTVTLITAVTLPPVAPFTQAWATLFMQALWTPPAGSPATIYNGTPGGFLPTGFTIPNTTTWPAVTGFASYTDGCAVRVPALLDTFTPTGPSGFAEVGVNAGVNSSGAGPNGTFYIGGFFTAYDVPGANIPANSFTRLKADMTLDTTFNAVVTDTSFMRVVGAGDAGSIGKYLQGPNVNGKPSYTFANAGVNYSIKWSGSQWDITNETTATLLYHSVNDTPFPSSVVTWLADAGALPVPTVTTGGFNLDVRSMSVDALGRITVAGSFTLFNDVTANRIIRIMPDGTRDPSFVTGTGFNIVCNQVRLQSDGKAVCSGAFTSYNGQPVGRVVRINVDGSIDNTFNNIAGVYQAGFDAAAYRNEIDTDGSILVNSGQPSYGHFNGTEVLYPGSVAPPIPAAAKTMVRLKPNGQLQAIVAQGRQFNSPVAPTNNSFAIQPDGKILYVGSFTTYNGVTVNGILRTDEFGVLDAAFLANTGIGFDSVNAQTTTVAILPNGYILIGCQSGVTYQGVDALCLIRLKADGTLDSTFNIGTGFNNSVIDLTITTLGDIIVGGTFTSLDGTPSYYVAKF